MFTFLSLGYNFHIHTFAAIFRIAFFSMAKENSIVCLFPFHHPLTHSIDTNRIWEVWKNDWVLRVLQRIIVFFWSHCLFWKRCRHFDIPMKLLTDCCYAPLLSCIPLISIHSLGRGLFRELRSLIFFFLWGKQLIQHKSLKCKPCS